MKKANPDLAIMPDRNQGWSYKMAKKFNVDFAAATETTPTVLLVTETVETVHVPQILETVAPVSEVSVGEAFGQALLTELGKTVPAGTARLSGKVVTLGTAKYHGEFEVNGKRGWLFKEGAKIISGAVKIGEMVELELGSKLAGRKGWLAS